MGCNCGGTKLPASTKQQVAAAPTQRPTVINVWNGPKPKSS